MELGRGETLIAEAPFGFGPLAGVVSLTDRRIVLAGPDSEESVPLAALTSVRATFARNWGGVVWGAVLLSLAIGFGAAYRPMETALNGAVLAIERRLAEKPPEGSAFGHYLHLPMGLVWTLMLPLIGWGVYKVADGAIGRTELAIATASAHLVRSGRGRREDLLDFGAEVGRQAGR